MKKLKKIVLTLAATVTLFGCKGNVESLSNTQLDNEPKTEIGQKILSLKNAGLLDNLNILSRNVENNDEAILLDRFINNTDEVIEEIRLQEDGEIQLRVLDALFCDKSTDEFAEAFYAINPEKSDDFKEQVNNLSNSLEGLSDSNNIVLSENLNSNTIAIQYKTDILNNESRKIFASDLEWSTILCYSGFCAATIAGTIAASYGGFWVRIAGAVATVAGLGSMTAQLTIWCTCSDLGTLIKSLYNQDSKTATKILNSGYGWNFVAIISATTAAIATFCLSPVGRTIIKTVITYANRLITNITSIFPRGFTPTIQGIPVKPIEMSYWL